MTSCIYKITNLINNKIYIGKTDNPNRRWKKHLLDSKKYKNRYLYRAMNKYGSGNFKFEIIHDDIPNSEIDYFEKKYISMLESKVPKGYNMTDGGEGSIGRIMKESTKLKIIESNKGRVQSKDERKKRSIALEKYYSNPENRELMSKKTKGIPKNNKENYLKYWNKLSNSQIKDRTKNMQEARKVSIIMLDINSSKEIMEFDSVRGASKWIRENTKYEKAGHQNIVKACKGNINHVYGYKWKYK